MREKEKFLITNNFSHSLDIFHKSLWFNLRIICVKNPSPLHQKKTFPRQQILHSSKLKDFADDNFRFAESGQKFSKRVENTVGKGEIACYEEFLVFPQCFQKIYTADK